MTQPRLLLLEDDLLILRTLGQGLRDAGYDVLEAETAEAAIALCAETPPDLAMLDIRMPGMSGLEFGQWLAQRHIPFLFLTAYDDEGFIEQAQAIGAMGYLVKPLDVPKIIPSLKTVLAKAKELAQLRDSESKLTAALEDSRTISTAVGLLMERLDLDADAAFSVLRKEARGRRARITELAEGLINKGETDWCPPRQAVPKSSAG